MYVFVNKPFMVKGLKGGMNISLIRLTPFLADGLQLYIISKI